MAKKKYEEKKPRNRFKIGLFIYLLILALLLAGANFILWNFLEGYQARQDAEALEAAQLAEQKAHEKAVYQAPQRAFEAFMAGADAEYWTGEWFTAHPDTLDVREKVLAEFERLFCGEGTVCYKQADFNPAAPVYVVKNGEQELATVSLQGSELNWSVKDVRVELEGKESASIEVIDGSSVYCNGVKLDPALAGESKTYFDNAELQEALKNPVSWTTYKVEGLLFAPELTAEAPADKTLVTAEDGTMHYVLSADAASPYQKQSEEMVKTLLRYYMLGNNNTNANMGAVLALLPYDSPAYKLVAQSYDGVIWDSSYPNATYEATAGDVIIWADNCMSVDVQYHAEGTSNGVTNLAEGVYRIYFFDNGSGYGIYSFARL